MESRNYSRVALQLGAVILAGLLQTMEADAAQEMKYMEQMREASMPKLALLEVKDIWRAIGAKSQYIEGMGEIGAQVLQRLEEETKEEEAIMLFARGKGLEGTRAYANVTNYVNVRAKASTSSEVVGKLYGGCVATVLEEEGDWVYVNSGNVTGYVIKEYLLFGSDAEEAIAKKYTPKVTVTANVLNIRSGAGTGYSTIGQFGKGEEAQLLERGKEWMKIRFSSGGEKKTGFVYAAYVTVTGEPAVGETLAEEAARLAAEKKAAKEAAAKEAAAKAEAERKAAVEQTKRSKARQVANYAKTAVGTAYVWGGTNMKTGVDCSGLCYAAYKAYGYTLPRVSRDMAASSSLLSVTPNKTQLVAGDLVFYATGGRVDHVAMYLGDGKVVHASDYTTGVIISNYNYRTPHSAKRVIY